jgi:hypothetical protein
VRPFSSASRVSVISRAFSERTRQTAQMADIAQEPSYAEVFRITIAITAACAAKFCNSAICLSE